MLVVLAGVAVSVAKLGPVSVVNWVLCQYHCDAVGEMLVVLAGVVVTHHIALRGRVQQEAAER